MDENLDEIWGIEIENYIRYRDWKYLLPVNLINFVSIWGNEVSTQLWDIYIYMWRVDYGWPNLGFESDLCL